MKRFFLLGLFFLVPLQTATAQIFEDLDYERCEVTKLHDYIYIPFGITVTHDPAIAQKIIDYHPNNPTAQLGKQVPENPSNDPTQATWITLTSNSTSNWYIQLSLDYLESSEEKPRKVIIDYKSNGIPVFIEMLSHTGKSWCRIFEVTSKIAPHYPTVEETLAIAGEIDRGDRNELKFLIDENTGSVKGFSSTQTLFTLVLIVILVVIALQLRGSGKDKQQLRARERQLNKDQGDFIQFANTMEMAREIRFSDMLGKYDKLRTQFIDAIGIAMNLPDIIKKYRQNDDKPVAEPTEKEKLITEVLKEEPKPEQQEEKGVLGFLKKDKESFNLDEEIEKLCKEYKNKEKYNEDKLIGIFNSNYNTALKNTNSPERAKVEAVSKVLKERRGVK